MSIHILMPAWPWSLMSSVLVFSLFYKAYINLLPSVTIPPSAISPLSSLSLSLSLPKSLSLSHSLSLSLSLSLSHSLIHTLSYHTSWTIIRLDWRRVYVNCCFELSRASTDETSVLLSHSHSLSLSLSLSLSHSHSLLSHVLNYHTSRLTSSLCQVLFRTFTRLDWWDQRSGGAERSGAPEER